MVFTYLDPPWLCNGTKCIVKQLMSQCIDATIATEKYKGEDAFIPQIPLKPSHCPLEFTRLQFPVDVCCAMSINSLKNKALQWQDYTLKGSPTKINLTCIRRSHRDKSIGA